MKRGDIFFANLNPSVGSKINKRRPVLIISNDINNQYANIITILPITSNIEKIYPFEVFIPKEDSNLSKDSKIQAQQIRTISKQRLESQLIGRLSEHLLKKVEKAILLHLGL